MTLSSTTKSKQLGADLNASELEAAVPSGIITAGGEDGGRIAGDGRTTGEGGTDVASEPPCACARLVTTPEALRGPARRLGGRVIGHGRPFLLTHTIKCMPMQNSARESLLSPSASASCQICRNCCLGVANGVRFVRRS